MSAGTITLTNGSAIVGGSGTSFATELAAGDFIVSTVGGVPYTLPVKSVESNAQLTLVSNFTGPTQSGAAWSAVPRVALNMVTAALVAQSAEALRGLNYDKQNWQQIFSSPGNATVKLPDGSSFTGPSWNSITTTINNKADKTDLESYAKKGDNSDITSLSGLTTALSVEQGGTGVKNLPALLTALGFGYGSNHFNVPASGRTLKIIAQSAVVSTNTGASGTVAFPSAFPAACLSVVAMNGDSAANNSTITLINFNPNVTSGFNFRAQGVVSGAVRINYIAIGY